MKTKISEKNFCEKQKYLKKISNCLANPMPTSMGKLKLYIPVITTLLGYLMLCNTCTMSILTRTNTVTSVTERHRCIFTLAWAVHWLLWHDKN